MLQSKLCAREIECIVEREMKKISYYLAAQ